MATEIPERMTIKGTMMTSGVVANGTLFDADSMARIADTFINRPFVANHERGIESAAGIITEVTAKRFRQKLEVKNPEAVDERVRAMGKGDPDKQRKRRRVEEEGKTYTVETGTKLMFQAEMNDDFPAYERVAKSILALRNSGATPNVSVSVIGEAIDYDPVVDEFVFIVKQGLHLGQVDVGALNDTTGVGVHTVEFSAGTFTIEMEGGDSFPEACIYEASASVHIENQAEIMASFCERYSDHPELTLRLSDALGLSEHDEVPPVEGDEEPAAAAAESQSNSAAEPSYTASPLDGHNGSQEPDEGNSMDEPNLELANQPDNTPAPKPAELAGGKPIGSPEPMVPLSQVKSMLAEEVGKIRSELEAEKSTVLEGKLSALRNKIANQFKVDADRLKVFTTEEALSAYAEDLESIRGTPFPESDYTPTEEEVTHYKEAESTRQDWQAKMASYNALGGRQV